MNTTVMQGAAAGPQLPRIITGRPWERELAAVIRDLGQLTELPAPLAVREGCRVLARLAQNPDFLTAQALPLGARARSGGPYVARRYDPPGGAYSLQLFVWPAGAQTQIHDHSCWGIFGPLAGALQEVRYLRLDDGSRANQAHLRPAWRRVWTPGAGLSPLLPYAGGIHRVSNPSGRAVISLHVYGPLGTVDGRDYDPLRDYVCDRLTDDTPGGTAMAGC